MPPLPSLINNFQNINWIPVLFWAIGSLFSCKNYEFIYIKILVGLKSNKRIVACPPPNNLAPTVPVGTFCIVSTVTCRILHWIKPLYLFFHRRLHIAPSSSSQQLGSWSIQDWVFCIMLPKYVASSVTGSYHLVRVATQEKWKQSG